VAKTLVRKRAAQDHPPAESTHEHRDKVERHSSGDPPPAHTPEAVDDLPPVRTAPPEGQAESNEQREQQDGSKDAALRDHRSSPRAELSRVAGLALLHGVFDGTDTRKFSERRTSLGAAASDALLMDPTKSTAAETGTAPTLGHVSERRQVKSRRR